MSAPRYPRYDRRRNRWTKSEMVSFVFPASDEGAAAALAAAQAHYGERRVIDMRVDGYVRNDPTRGAFYKPRLRAANAV